MSEQPTSVHQVRTRAYAYSCVDHSLLVEPFCRYFVRWFVCWMPAVIPANYLTIASSCSIWVMFVLAARSPSSPGLALAAVVLMAFYVIYDHADGMHARRTGTSGPFGEFLDHYLDAFHASLAVGAMFLIANRGASAALAPTLWAVSLGGVATMLEQRERHVLYFGLIGPLEGMLLTVGFLASWCFRASAHFWAAPLVAGVTRFQILVIAGGAGSIFTAFGSLRRIGRIPLPFVGYLALSAILGWACTHLGASPWAAPFALGLYGADYTGRLIASHLKGKSCPRPDWIAPVAATLFSFAHLVPSYSAGAILTYLAGRNLFVAGQTFSDFRSGWRWLNPPAART